jgi:pilus assembly protein CpaF
MLNLELCFEDGQIQRKRFDLPLLVGRGADCDLLVRTWRLARHHARFTRHDTDVFVEDFGALSGTFVNGQRISRYGPLQAGDQVVVGPCMIRIVALPEPNVSAPDPKAHLVPDRPPALCEPAACAVPDQQGGLLSDSRWQQQRQRLHGMLIAALDLRRHDVAQMDDRALRAEAGRVLAELLASDTTLPPDIDKSYLLMQVVNEAVGLGPLEPLLQDPAVTEIMVNRHDEIFIETDGVLQQVDVAFSGEVSVRGVIDRIVAPLGRRIDESSPMVDARLPDGSRVNAVIAPVALKGASLTIRKFPGQRPDSQTLRQRGAFDSSMQQFLHLCVVTRKNLLVAGGTGSGKTTLLNVLSASIPEHERVVTIEDAAELKLLHKNLVSLEARPANLEGKGRIEIRDLVRNALRMRPDRIVVGECRGPEAFDMLAAMNTGHEGSLTTLHANSPRDALARLETMILMAGMDLPLAAIREQIASSIHFIVQQTRLSNGHRLVSSIVEVTGIESGRIQTQPIFIFDRRQGGAFTGCGAIPECFQLADDPGQAGITLAMFEQTNPVQRAVLSHA